MVNSGILETSGWIFMIIDHSIIHEESWLLIDIID